MADSKKTGTRKGRSAVKPATIDLKAKDVSAEPTKSGGPAKDAGGTTKIGAASASKTATARSGAAKPATTRTETTTKSTPVKSAAAKTTSAPSAAKAADPKPAEKSAETTSPAPAATSGRPQGSAPERDKERNSERDRERPSVGMMPFAIAGGIGAVGAMAVMLAALWLGLLPVGNGASGDVDALRSDLDQRIAALESEQTSLASSIADGAVTGDLEARIAALEDRPAVSADGGVDLGPIETALADQQAAIAEIEAILSGATSTIDSVTERTTALEGEVDAAIAGIGDSGGADGALLASLRERLEAAEQSLASLGETIAAAADQSSASGSEIAGLSDAVAALRGDVDAASGEMSTAAAAREALGAEVVALQEADAGLQARAEDLAGAIAALTTRLDDAETQLGANDPGRTARALAIGRVSEALARGGDLGASLTALQETLPEGQTLPDVLTVAAEQGLATPAEIAAAFPQAVDAILDASRAGQDASIGARLLDNARSVIRVRPVGAVEGDTPEAIVSRIEAGLAGGDLAGAHAEWRSLPEPARTASADWGAMIGARLEAQAALDALAAEILASLTGESG